MRLIITILLGGSLALMFLVGGCSQAGRTQAPGLAVQPTVVSSTMPVSVQVALVQLGVLSNTVSYAGNIQARQQVSLIPKGSGRVITITVDVGSVVKAGDVLAQLDQTSAQIQVQQAEAALRSAQARANQLTPSDSDLAIAQAAAAAAEASYDSAVARYNQLVAGPTQNDIIVLRAAVDRARANLQAAQANYDRIGWRDDVQSRPEAVALQQATIDYNTALAAFNAKTAPPTQADLKAAQAAVHNAKQALTNAQVKLDQTTNSSSPDLAVARASVDQAKASLAAAKTALNDTNMVAPFDGVISQRLVSVGAMVGPTSPIFTLLSPDTEVVINVNEQSLAAVKAGQRAMVSVIAYPGKEFPATVTNVSPSVDAKSRTSEVRLSPQDPDGVLHNGMFAQVQLAAGGTERTSLLVPQGAVIQENGTTVVYVVANGQVSRQAVKTGTSNGDQIEIAEGLTEGQQVAISGLSGLHDGAEVKVQ